MSRRIKKSAYAKTKMEISFAVTAQLINALSLANTKTDDLCTIDIEYNGDLVSRSNQRLCFRFIDSMMPLPSNPKFQASSLLL